jgi:transcriptional regulator with XRE-family HTH domain
MAEKGVFAERLRQLRKQAGLSQVVLAKKAGVSVSAVRQFETGHREPNYRTLLKLAHGLGV